MWLKAVETIEFVRTSCRHRRVYIDQILFPLMSIQQSLKGQYDLHLHKILPEKSVPLSDTEGRSGRTKVVSSKPAQCRFQHFPHCSGRMVNETDKMFEKINYPWFTELSPSSVWYKRENARSQVTGYEGEHFHASGRDYPKTLPSRQRVLILKMYLVTSRRMIKLGVGPPTIVLCDRFNLTSCGWVAKLPLCPIRGARGLHYSMLVSTPMFR